MEEAYSNLNNAYPVSYTHLDVYKRQSGDSWIHVNGSSVSYEENPAKEIRSGNVTLTQEESNMKPVSYTHLPGSLKGNISLPDGGCLPKADIRSVPGASPLGSPGMLCSYWMYRSRSGEQ